MGLPLTRQILRSPFRQAEAGNLPRLVYLRFLYELFPAAGAGDGDFAFAPGDPDHLAALGAVEIAVLPVLHPAENLQELPVFLIAFIGVPGQHPENGPEHHAIAEKEQNQIHRGGPEEHRQQAGSQTHAEDGRIQFVGAVAAHHKIAQSHGKPGSELPEPTAESVHTHHLWEKCFSLLYCKNR